MTLKSFTLPLAAAATFAGALMAAQPAEAQGRICAPRDKIIEQLESRHGEIRQNYGLQQNAAVIETWANTDTGSWTIIMSTPDGMSCLVAVGEAFQSDKKKVSMLKGDNA